MRYRDRRDAGRQLGEALARNYSRRVDGVVLALPRGGVPVAHEVAQVLSLPLDVFVVRKLGTPGHEELAMGAIASGGATVFNQEIIRSLGIPRFLVDSVITRERQELERRERQYRGDRPELDLRDKLVILVDDGLATGASMQAAAEAVRDLQPREIVIAVPVAAKATCSRLQHFADEVLCAMTPDPFMAVSAWYEDFSQVTDAEVQELLAESVA